MKVLLIIPPFDFLKDGYGTKVKIKAGNLPNLGTCYIASTLERANHTVQILDVQAEGMSPEEAAKKAIGLEPDLIGISITIAHYSTAKDMVQSIKSQKNVPIVCGGPHVTCFPEKILQENPGVDVAVIGEGEHTIVEIADAFANKLPLSKVTGIAYRDENLGIRRTEKRPILTNLDSLPIPAWHLVNFKSYSPLPDQYKRLPAVAMVTSRGCTWKKCTFCFQSNVNAMPYRRHSPKRIVSEIKMLQEKYGIKEIDFLDDEFFLNEAWVQEFCEMLYEEKIDLSWSALGRVDHVTENMFKIAKKAGCWGVFFGLETGNEDLLLKINKGTTLEQARKACKWANDAGLEIRGSFMLGLPDETPEKACKTIDFAIELGLATAAFHLAYPEYGTKFYDIALKEGSFVALKKGDYSNKWIKKTSVSYVPNGYKDAKELEEMQKLAFRKFYFRPAYLFKRLKSIRSFADIKRNYDGLKFLIGIVD